MIGARLLLLLACLLAFGQGARAHEVRPAYLELRQTAADTYEVLWKVPALEDQMRLAIAVTWPLGSLDLSEPRGVSIDRACIARWAMRRVQRHAYEPGTLILRRGNTADALYFLMRGEVSVIVDLPGGGHKRLSTLSAGMGFGESALIAGGSRSADVRADTAVECCTLDTDAFVRLESECPSLMIRLLHNLLHSTANTAVRLTAEVAALEG